MRTKDSFFNAKNTLTILSMTAWLTLLISGCQQDPIVVTNPASNGKIKQFVDDKEVERIYAWQAPYSLTDGDIPSNVVSKLQNAINDAAQQNKQLILEKGTYTIDSTITFPSGADVDFGGSEFVREPGTASGDIFTMFTNADHTKGNTDITIKDLKINGNKNADSLVATTWWHCFSGLELNKVSNSKLYRITVTQTVNTELNGIPASGIFFQNGCNNIDCYELTCYEVDRTAIYINASSNIRIYGSLTYNNYGTGIACDNSPRCEFNNITSYHNGFYPGHIWGEVNPPEERSYRYSNLSINGTHAKVNNVITYDCTGSGLVLGHPGSPTVSADYAIVNNVESFGCELDGITISNSKHALLSNLNVHDNLRNNIQVYDSSSHIQIQNASIHGYNAVAGVPKGGQGIKITGGAGHNLNNLNIYNNFGQGIYITQTTGPVSIGSEVNAYNNGMYNYYQQPGNHNLWTAGIEAQNASHIYINNSKAFSNQPSGGITQKYGIILQNVTTARINYPQCYGNGIQNAVKQLGTNTDVVILQ